MEWKGMGYLLILTGFFLLLTGLFFLLLPRLPSFLFRLPGDFLWEKGNLKVFFPLTTMLLVSVVLTLLLNLILFLLGKK